MKLREQQEVCQDRSLGLSGPNWPMTRLRSS